MMGNAAPAISVITIVRNNEELLPRAVDSVLEQNFTDFEHIIVNDGSTDNTKAIIDDYAEKDPRVKPQHIPQNVGRAMARNTGMDAANGKYILFLDSDDYLPKTALKDLFEVAEQYNADIVFGRFKCFDQLTGNWLQNHYTYKIINEEKHKFRLDDHLDLIDNHHIVGRLYRRELLGKNNIRFSTKRKNGEDVPFAFFTVFYAMNISMVPQHDVYFYSLGNYLAAADESKLFDARDNMLDTYDFVLKYGSDLLKKRMLQKGAMFAGSLERAQKIYDNDEAKFKIYFNTLIPFVKDITDDILTSLPKYFESFAKALLSDNIDEAYRLWVQRNAKEIKKKTKKVDWKAKISSPTSQQPEFIVKDKLELEKLRLVNKELAQELDRIYKTWSWRITAPLRRISRGFFLKKKSERQASAPYTSSCSKSVVVKRGLDLSHDLKNPGFGQHRCGWNYALHSLSPLHNQEGFYLVSFLEKVFLWAEPKPIVFPRPWVGFTHRPHNIPDWFPSDLRRFFYQNDFFQDVLPSCRGIFTLSEYLAKHISQQLSVPIESLIHPTEIPDKQWDPAVLSDGNKLKVVQVGFWLRNLHGIFMLPSGDYEKIYLTKREREETISRIFSLEAKLLKRKRLFTDTMYNTAKTVDFLTNDEYDALLANCIVFLDLYDASANNAVIECIARSTPILINPLEPVVEYLGKDYPLYYKSYEEAVEKLHNKDLLHATHEYLKRCATRKKLSGSYFRKSLEKSKIYTSNQ